MNLNRLKRDMVYIGHILLTKKIYYFLQFRLYIKYEAQLISAKFETIMNVHYNLITSGM